MDCMVPPLENPPEGEWHCPQCPPVITDDQHQFPQPADGEQSSIPSAREPSIASSSRSALDVQPTPTKAKRGRKSSTRKKIKTAKAAASEGSDIEDVQETPVVYRGRGRPPKGTVRVKPRVPIASSDEERETLSARPHRRKRLREPSPATSSRVVRLRIPPQRGKGKEREEEEPDHGLFDDILGIEERDMSKTTPTPVDKAYFERSRIAAEVSSVCILITLTNKQLASRSHLKTLFYFNHIGKDGASATPASGKFIVSDDGRQRQQFLNTSTQ